MTSTLLKQKHAWIMLVLIITIAATGQNTISTANTIVKGPEGESASESVQRKTQFKSINIQVPANADAAQAAQAISPEDLEIGTQSLSNFYFYLDPGHNAAGGPPSPQPSSCRDRGANHNNLHEGDLTWNIADKLRAILRSKGVPQSHIFMSRPWANKYVTIEDRVDGTDMNHKILCSTYGNNALYLNTPGTNSDNWRFVSIHLNAGGGGTERVEVYHKVQAPGRPAISPLAIDFAENMSWQLNRPYIHPNAPYFGRWTRAYEREACGTEEPVEPLPCDIYVLRYSLPRSYEDPIPGPNYSHPGSYNTYAEVGYLDNPGFNTWIEQSNNQQAMAQALYRGLTDFFVVGKRDSIRNKYPNIFEEYRQNILQGKDPGVPFANGPEYYVHQYPGGQAWTQEFRTIDETTKGSILECISTPGNPCSSQGGGGYYVRQPIWDTYIQKNGPNINGPGRPWGVGINRGEHEWSTNRSYPPRGDKTYPKTQNFEHGAIYWNDYESKIRPGQPSHAVFLPNCKAYDIGQTHVDLLPYVKNMIGRFSLSNDARGPVPQPTPLPGYFDGGLHANDEAYRSQLAQSLVMAENFPYYTENNWEYGDIQGHWARPWIRIAANMTIANGYPDGWRPDAKVTRGQFSKMITVAQGWTRIRPGIAGYSPNCPSASGGYRSFKDVCFKVLNAQGQWVENEFYDWIETVKSKDAIGGYDTINFCNSYYNIPCFRPLSNVTRAQMSKIVDLALRNNDPPYPPPANPCWGEPPLP